MAFTQRQKDTHDYYENKGFQLLKQIAPTLKLTQLNQHEEGDRIDYDAMTSKGNKINIEVKTRDLRHNQYSTSYIRKDKLKALIDADGHSLFINFFNDGFVGVWIITKADIMYPTKWCKVWNEGYGRYEWEENVELPNTRKNRCCFFMPIGEGQYKPLEGYSFS